MSREPGSPKTGGRKKGTPNRRTRELHETLNQLKIDLPKKIIDLMPQLSPEKQVDVYLRLMPYFYPKRKPLDPRPPNENKEKVVVYLPDNGRSAGIKPVPYEEVRAKLEKRRQD